MRVPSRSDSCQTIYAYYGKDDCLVAVGTADEVARKLGITYNGVISCAKNKVPGYYRVGKELKTDMERILACLRRLKTHMRKDKPSEWQLGYYNALEDVRKIAEDLQKQDEEYAAAQQAELDYLFSKE